MAHHSPSHPPEHRRDPSPFSIRIAAQLQQSPEDHQVTFVTSNSSPAASPYLSARGLRSAPSFPRLDTKAADRTNLPSPLRLSPKPHVNHDRALPSPNRTRGSSGDEVFDSIKAVASKDALLERSIEQADARAHGRPSGSNMPAVQTGRSLSPPPSSMSRPALSGPSTILQDPHSVLASSPSGSAQVSHPSVDYPETVDVPALIAAAGSPESAIRKLLQDKYAVAQNNAQLWRLMNKQRAMMAELDRNLQKALKDRERFRKKLKEQLQAPASLAIVGGRAGAISDHDESAVSTPAEDNDGSDRDVVAVPTRDEPDQLAVRATVVPPMHASPMPPPYPSDPRFPSRSTSLHKVPTPASEGHADPAHGGPAAHASSETFTTSKPVSFSTPSKNRVHSMSRKGPPAPLDLSPARKNLPAEVSSSEYTGDSMPIHTPARSTSREDEHVIEPDSPSRGAVSFVAKYGRDALSPLSESGYSSPEEPGSPHVAQVQTYQSLNALNAVLKTPQSAGGTTAPYSAAASPREQSRGPLRTITSPLAARSAGAPHRHGSARPQPPPTPASAPMSHVQEARDRADITSRDELEISTSESFLPPNEPASPQSTAPTLFPGASSSPGQIFQGFVSPEWPGLLLPPTCMSSVTVGVDSSRLRPSRHAVVGSKQAEDSPVFSLSINSSSTHVPLWRVEKTLQALGLLDSQIRSLAKIKARLPERMLFAGHAPARMDARRTALDSYFSRLMEAKLTGQAANVLCTFLSLDSYSVEEPEYYIHQQSTNTARSDARRSRPRKEGYLTKKGKNFGGWKARYFVLDSETLRYYESLGGALLGAIKLQHASIGRQTTSTQEDVDEENQHRHAFLIMESKRKDRASHTKHVLCAESDEERDGWIKCLLAYVESEYTPPATARSLPGRDVLGPLGPDSPRSQKSMGDLRRSAADDQPPPLPDQLRAVMYDATVAADAPKMGSSNTMPPRATKTAPTATMSAASTTLDLPEDDPVSELQHPTISGPSNVVRIQDATIWGSKREPNVLVKNQTRRPSDMGEIRHKERKRSIFTFSGRTSTDSTNKDPSSQKDDSTMRPIFGAPLADVVDQATVEGAHAPLPMVVYRCLEYLKANDAVNEEGIFRVSGSNVTVRALRERFDLEGDVNLSDDGPYDVHAIASLLKLFLRELPANILTRELYVDFAKCVELDEHTRARACNILVKGLPAANRELLDHLTGFLKEIVSNERSNKMNIRNVGIVFSPTMNIPAPLMSSFVTDHAVIFGPTIQEVALDGKLRNFLANIQLSASSHSLQPRAEIMRTPNRSLSREPPTPSSEAPFASPFGRDTDYLTLQRMAKDAYDIGYTPTNTQASSRGLSASNTVEEPLSPAGQPAHTSFHSMHFPDPPLTARSARFAPNVMSSTTSTGGAISSHGSTSTLSPIGRQASLANTLGSIDSKNSNSGERSESSTSSSSSPAMPYSSTFASLNDIDISSSPLMGGTSPEFSRSIGFNSNDGIYSTGLLGGSQASNPWAPLATSNLANSLSASSISTTTRDTHEDALLSASASGPHSEFKRSPTVTLQHSDSRHNAQQRSISNPSSATGHSSPTKHTNPSSLKGVLLPGLPPRSISSGNTPLVTNLERKHASGIASVLERNGSVGTGVANGQGHVYARSHAALALGPQSASATDVTFGRRLLRRQSGQLLSKATAAMEGGGGAAGHGHDRTRTGSRTTIGLGVGRSGEV